jgi:hypothetical protein
MLHTSLFNSSTELGGGDNDGNVCNYDAGIVADGLFANLGAHLHQLATQTVNFGSGLLLLA